MPFKSDVFLGFCIKTPLDGSFGKIKPLAKIKKRPSDGAWVVDHEFEMEDFGANGFVFWYDTSPPRRSFNGMIVRFRVSENEKHFGSDDPTKSWYQVARKPPYGNSDIEDASIFLINESEANYWQKPLIVHDVPSGVTVYLRNRQSLDGTTITGPWKTLAEPERTTCRLVPETQNIVYRWRLERLDKDMFLPWYLGWPNECLVHEPDPKQGELLDLAPPDQMARWLLKRLKSLAPEALATLERMLDWKQSLQEDVGDLLGKEKELELHRQRWDRIGPILDHLSNESVLLDELVQNNPRFSVIIRRAVEGQIETRRQEIEDNAADRAVARLNELEREREEEEREGRRVLEELEAKIEQGQSKLEALTDRRTKEVKFSRASIRPERRTISPDAASVERG